GRGVPRLHPRRGHPAPAPLPPARPEPAADRGAPRQMTPVQTYHQARFSGDAVTAIAQLTEDFTFTSPLMTSDAAGHLATLDGFLQIVTGVDMISELYGENEATLIYDVHTATPVGTQRTAEHFTLA